MKSCSLNSGPPWSISFSKLCWNIIRQPGKPLTIGPAPSLGTSSSSFPLQKACSKRDSAVGRSFFIPTNSGAPETAEKRLALFAQANEMKASPAITKAKSQLALSLCQLLRTLEQQLDGYRQQIEALFKEHPDHDLFGGLPGAKKFLAPRLLAAIGTDPNRYGNHNVLQCFAGTAPVRFQSGQISKVKIRWACDKFLRQTVHLWANCFRRASAWGQTYYEKKREQGMNHACALRCLGQRLLKIVFKMLVDKKPYDAELHARNQQKHGSWVLKLINENPIQRL